MQTFVTKKTLLLTLLLLVAGSACAEWVKVISTDEVTSYIDPATIRKDGNLRKVWELQDLKQRYKEGEMSRRIRTEYDCKDQRYRLFSISTHSEPMAGGEMIVSSGGGGWREVPPDTTAEVVLKIVCAK